jgi:hypothetical protein
MEMAPMGETPLGLSHGHLPVTPVHTAREKVRGELDRLMSFE